MIKAVIFDLSRVLLFPNDTTYKDSLNTLHKTLSASENYDPFDHFHLNIELLKYLETLQYGGDFYIFTSDVIQDAPGLQSFLKPIFRKIYSASKMNIHKKDVNAYKKILEDLHLVPEEALYIDDNAENIEAAASAGLFTIQYHSNDDLFVELQKSTKDIRPGLGFKK